MDAVTLPGVAVQHPAPGVTESQAPPFPVAEATVKEIAVPVLETFTICGEGLAPPNVLENVKEPASTKMFVPTTTLTGTVTVPPALLKTSSPTKVPATKPLDGRALVTMPMPTVAGAAPLGMEVVSQLPPSAVLVVTVQFN